MENGFGVGTGGELVVKEGQEEEGAFAVFFPVIIKFLGS